MVLIQLFVLSSWILQQHFPDNVFSLDSIEYVKSIKKLLYKRLKMKNVCFSGHLDVIPCIPYIHFITISMQQTVFYGHFSRSRRKTDQ